ncbi:MAG: flippase [Bacteroidota bacterium]
MSSIFEKSTLKKTSANIGWLTLDKLIRMGGGLVISVLVARYLGPDQFGLWSYALAIIAIIGSISSLGLESVIVNEIVKSEQRKSKFLGSGFIIRLVSALVSYLSLFLIVYLLEPDNDILKYIVSILGLTFFFQAFDILDYFFQSQLQNKFTFYARNISFGIFSGIKILFIIGGYSLVYFAWAFAVEIMFASLLLMVFYLKSGEHVKNWNINKTSIAYLIKQGLPLMLSAIITLLHLRIDQVMLGQILGEKELGVYSSAVKISEVWYQIPMLIGMSFFPSIIKSRGVNKDTYFNNLKYLYSIIIWASIAFSIVVTFTATPIINIVYGVDYAAAAPVLSIYVWGGVLIAPSSVSNRHYVIERKTKYAFFKGALGLVINISLNLVLIKKYGSLGAAYSTLVSYLVMGSIGDLLFDRKLFNLQLKSFFAISHAYNLIKARRKFS